MNLTGLCDFQFISLHYSENMLHTFLLISGNRPLHGTSTFRGQVVWVVVLNVLKNRSHIWNETVLTHHIYLSLWPVATEICKINLSWATTRHEKVYIKTREILVMLMLWPPIQHMYLECTSKCVLHLIFKRSKYWLLIQDNLKYKWSLSAVEGVHMLPPPHTHTLILCMKN